MAIVQGAEWPPCTFGSCPVCLPDARRELRNVTLQGQDGLTYSGPLRIAGQTGFWDSQMLLAQVVGILVQEKLGIEVSYVPCEDEVKCILAIRGCAGWEDDECIVPRTEQEAVAMARAGRKRLPGPSPDIHVVLEMWSVALGTKGGDKDGTVAELGSSGFTTQDGLYICPAPVQRAWEDQRIALMAFNAYTVPGYRAYLSAPKELIDDGVQPEVQGCSSNSSVTQGFMHDLAALGFICVDSWWLAPACAALGSHRWREECFVVIDDDWGYAKPELYRAIATSGMLAAKLTVGYYPMLKLVRSQLYNLTFTWWSTDTAYLDLLPVRIAFEQDLEPDQVTISKMVLQPLLQNPQLRTLLTQAMWSNKELSSLLKVAAAERLRRNISDRFLPAFSQKLACDYLRQRETWQAWLPSPRSCATGEFYDEDSLHCVLCPTGRHWLRGRGGDAPSCAACPAGFYADSGGQTACAGCAPGRFQNASGSSGCLPCAVGSFAAGAGSALCERCGANRSAPELWTTMRLMEGSARWVIADGASEPWQCGCDAGAWQVAKDRCILCTEGMRCEGMGRGSPQLLPGYYAMIEEPFSIYRCVDASVCPGGPPGTCASPRSGLQCARCPEGSIRSDCSVCSGWSRAFLVFSPFLGLGLTALAYRVSNSPLTVNASLSLTSSVWAGMVATSCQVLSVLFQLKIPWPAASSGLLSTFSIFMVDFATVAPECTVGQGATGLYLLQALLPVAVVFFAVVRYLFDRLLCCIWPGREKIVYGSQMVNTVGMLLQLLFIPFVVISARPLQCKRHPNGAFSMLLFPEVLCFTKDHHPMLVMAIILQLFFLLPFFVTCVWIVLRAPAMQGECAAQFFMRWRFLLYRFRPDVWWWGVIFLLRQLLLALASLIPSSDPHLQVLHVSSTLALYLALLCRLWPWKNIELNIFEAGMIIILLLVVLSSTAFVPVPGDAHVYGDILMALLGLKGALVALMAILIIRQLCRCERGEFVAIQVHEVSPRELARELRWWARRWARLDEETLAGFLEMMNRYDRSSVAAVCKMWHVIAPDGVPQAFRASRSSVFGARCHVFRNSAAAVTPEELIEACRAAMVPTKSEFAACSTHTGSLSDSSRDGSKEASKAWRACPTDLPGGIREDFDVDEDDLSRPSEALLRSAGRSSEDEPLAGNASVMECPAGAP